MQNSLNKILAGYKLFRQKYVDGNNATMAELSQYGQRPEVMVVACCDSRVDPALLLQCHPGDLFVARNVANIIPPYVCDESHHGTSAALEFGICYLQVKHLIILGHSQCGGINAVIDSKSLHQNDFISHWVNLVQLPGKKDLAADEYAKTALLKSHANAMTFPWIKQKVAEKKLQLHLWFFDVGSGCIEAYHHDKKKYQPLCF